MAALPQGAAGEAVTRSDLNERWDQANTFYNNGNYASAIDLYESILSEGYISGKLFYNLGNAYFRENQLGEAILNYAKAQRLSPSDKDIEYNLNYATSLVKDRIEVMPDFIVNKWVRDWRQSLNSNQWATLSLVFLGLALGCVLLYILARKNTLRKTGFYGSVVSGVFFVIFVIFSSIERKAFLDASHAVVTNASAVVKSSPGSSGSELFILHEGTIVEIGETMADWVEITIADGRKGWILNKAIDHIRF